jgi:hypothetical protein
LFKKQGRNPPPNTQLVFNLAGCASELFTRGYLELPNGKILPEPTADFTMDTLGVNVKQTYVKLGYDPCVRIRFYWHGSKGADGEVKKTWHHVDLDFHWPNDMSHNGRGVMDFEILPGSTLKGCERTMTFRTTYVTVSGLPKANSEPYRERMGEKGSKVVDESSLL